MSRARLLLVSALLVPLALFARPAVADDVQAARQHFTKGTKDFDLGLYDDAIREYMAAYDAKPDPALLYNIAQAHKLAGHPSEALRFYKVYLSRVPDAPNADEVRAKIAELQRAVDQQQKAQAMPPDQVKPLGSVGTAEPGTPPPAAAAPSPSVPPASDASRARTMKIAGIVTAGVGVAALAAGIGLAVVAKNDSDQLTALDQQHGTFDPSKDSSGRTLGTAGPVLIGVGAALAVAGGVVTILGVRASRARQLALAGER